MALNINKGNRKGLSEEQRDFLIKASSLAKTISNWIDQKAIFLKIPNPTKIDSSIILAEMIIESQWGTHPLAQPFYNKKYSNNLTLIPADKYWQGKSHKYNGVSYRSYQDWITFATDYSDRIVFSDKYKHILRSDNPLLMLSSWKEDPVFFAAKAAALVEFYSLDQI